MIKCAKFASNLLNLDGGNLVSDERLLELHPSRGQKGLSNCVVLFSSLQTRRIKNYL